MDSKHAECGLAMGEKLHVVERRKFEADLRRHFVGEVDYCSDYHLRATGNLYVFNGSTGLFERIEPVRTRLFANDNNIVITVLPTEFDLTTALYKRVRNEMLFCDASGFTMELGDFGTHG